MLNLEAYTLSSLQTTRAILSDAGELSMDELRTLIDAHIAEQFAARSEPQKGSTPAQRTLRPCPSCGRGVLVPVKNRDGLRLVGCPSCRYSCEVD